MKIKGRMEFATLDDALAGQNRLRSANLQHILLPSHNPATHWAQQVSQIIQQYK